MKNLSTNKAIVYLWLFLMFFGGCIFSCNSVKRVNKNPEKQLRVIKDYSLKYGFRNDTTFIIKKGDSVVLEKTDTVVEKTLIENTDTIIVTKVITKIKTVYKVDTVIKQINNRESEIALQNIIKQNETTISESKINAISIEASRDKWRLRFIVSLSVIAFIIIILFIKR